MRKKIFAALVLGCFFIAPPPARAEEGSILATATVRDEEIAEGESRTAGIDGKFGQRGYYSDFTDTNGDGTK